jgi:P27 family predicted phage terminase small subunit
MVGFVMAWAGRIFEYRILRNMKGRKPKPTHLKLITGNPGKRPLNDAEPIPVGELTDPPAWMTDSQKEGWRYAIDHAPKGLLKKLDRSVLAVWVVAEDLHRQASEFIGKKGLAGLLARTSNDTLIQGPMVGILNKQAQVMLKAAEQLGFTPASRSRISVPELSGQSNPFNKI